MSVPWTTTAPSTSGSASAASEMRRDLEQLREPEVARRHEAVVDRTHLGDLVEPARPGEDRGAVERRDVAAAHRVDLHADRAAREDDDDPAHSLGSPRLALSGARSAVAPVDVGWKGQGQRVQGGEPG